MFDPHAARVLRVLSVAHTAVSRDAGRRRYYPLASLPSLDVHLVVPMRWYQFGRWRDADPAGDPGLTLHALPIRLARGGPAKWYMHWYPGLGHLVRSLKPQVLHLWEEPWGFVALQAAIWAWRRPETALVLEVDQNILKRLLPPFGLIRRFVLKHTTLILSRSDEATEVVRACGYRGPVHPISYGVDQAVFSARHDYDPPLGRALRIGYVGRLVEEKGLDDALAALALTQSPVVLDIMGEGPQEAALKARAAALGLTGRVTFSGWGSPADVSAFISRLDALVLLTRTTAAVREQFGRVIVEAQSCGVPVIGSTCGAIPDVIGCGGWVVGERDPAALARLLDRLASSPEQLQGQSAGALLNVADRFTFDSIATALLRAWRSAAALHHAPSVAEPGAKSLEIDTKAVVVNEVAGC